MDSQLQEARRVFQFFLTELDKAVIGLDDVKVKTIIAFLCSVATTMTKEGEENRRVGSGLVLYKGVPGTGKTYVAQVTALVLGTSYARLQGTADRTPSDYIGVVVYNPKTGEFEVFPGPLVKASIVLADELNRQSPKTQSAFIEPFQERRVTLGDTTYDMPTLSFGIATMNPIETGQGTFELSEALSDRFLFNIEVGYLSPDEEERLVTFDITKVVIHKLPEPERIISLRSDIWEKVYLDSKLAKYIRRLIVATRPLSTRKKEDNIGCEEYDVKPSPSLLVEQLVQLGASGRVGGMWDTAAKARALCIGGRDYVLPEDIIVLAPSILAHRLSLHRGKARQAGKSVYHVIRDVIEQVAIP